MWRSEGLEESLRGDPDYMKDKRCPEMRDSTRQGDTCRAKISLASRHREDEAIVQSGEGLYPKPSD